ncbi:MAG: peptide-methionine (R)-S-oxide reductase MsrB [Cyclobacteriaceae bacterium]|nr:peptide-methionine (R)-S-oxide reductase MsrB [Cyclobacteriaceae bacterium HetDA_MAG_MS6]
MENTKDRVEKTEEEWKELLSPEEYEVLRKKGTERAWTGSLLNNKEKGIYECSACGNALYKSDAKYDSGSGWPSFYQPISKGAVVFELDKTFGMIRTEVKCGKCNSHLGHMFTDGPQPTGERYCMNSISMKFKKDG